MPHNHNSDALIQAVSSHSSANARLDQVTSCLDELTRLLESRLLRQHHWNTSPDTPDSHISHMQTYCFGCQRYGHTQDM